MLVACLDTATLTLSCALCEVAGGRARLIADRTERAPARPGPHGPTGGHGGRLPGALQDLLVSVDRKLPDIEGYAIGLGPGSFTGLRIGLATWKGLAYANRRPIAGCSSLAAMAVAAASTVVEGGALLVPLLDAKKHEVYAGFYRAEGDGVRAVAPDAALPPAALAERVRELGGGERPLAFGDGVAALGEVAGRVPTVAGVETPTALGVGILCAALLDGAPYDAARLFALEPHYIRPSEAELKFPHGLGPGAR